MKISACLAVVVLSLGCVSLDYDLAPVSVPISAKPAEPGAAFEPFTIEARNVLWIHGLAGRSQPDVVALIEERAQGYDRIAGFRVEQKSNFHQWLLTHLSLTLVRMKTVEITGQLIKGG